MIHALPLSVIHSETSTNSVLYFKIQSQRHGGKQCYSVFKWSRDTLPDKHNLSTTKNEILKIEWKTTVNGLLLNALELPYRWCQLPVCTGSWLSSDRGSRSPAHHTDPATVSRRCQSQSQMLWVLEYHLWGNSSTDWTRSWHLCGESQALWLWSRGWK